nr:MAG TPA: hypothetical protein [Caudoviricetes sp.]
MKLDCQCQSRIKRGDMDEISEMLLIHDLMKTS